MRVGFVGLGIMGLPMARNLRKAGFAVTAYARRAAPRDAFAADGGAVAATPRAVAAASDVIVTMVTDSADVEQVVLGPGGIREGARSGALVVDMSTISPAATRRIGARLAEQGIGMLDAPVSGGEQGAIAGTLSIMVGGAAADLERARPLLAAMGSKITHCGPLGAGQTVKLCNQVAICGTLLGVCEALVLAARSGVDPAVMLEAVSAGAAGSWQMSNLGPRMLARDFAPGFKVSLMRKDLRLAVEAAGEQAAVLPGLALVSQLFGSLQALAGEEQGTQALVQVLETLSGCRVGETPAR